MDQRLETFLTVCATMNYRKAAEQLHLTQPAVTKQIQALEAMYSVRLFTYDSRKLKKTAQGETLEIYAISQRYQDEELRRALKRQEKTSLRIGATKSIGDYILTGGELGAMVLVDCVARLVPGVLGCEESAQTESFSSGLLEYPQYTRPRAFEGLTVPEPLLNGNHAHIVDWQLSESLYITLRRRPEMAKAYLDGRKFTRHQQKVVDAVFDRIREEDEAAKAQTEEQP